jgi:hypothetical protein
MSDRLTPYAGALASAIVLIALGGACSAQELQPQAQPPRLPDVPSPRFLYIHCATEVLDGPCGLDPAMQRLSVEPRFHRPDVRRAPEPPDRPDFSPPR